MTYEQKKQALMQKMQSAGSEAIGLQKSTSNLFRERADAPKKKLNVRHFNQVIAVNKEEQWVEVEGMMTYGDLVAHLLPLGFMPAVVPQLKTITIGGAAAGVGIEATSFRHGLVHETILAMEILLPNGNVILAKPTNEHKDLFYGFPNSYGTLGYALKLKATIIPVKKYVHVTHRRCTDATEFFRALEVACNSDADFVDGVVFANDEMYVSCGCFTDEAPYTHDYTYMNIYYRSIQKNNEDFLTAEGYIWRWDTDWFWCSKYIGVQNPIIRLLAGRRFLNSKTYTKLMRLNGKWKFTERIQRFLGYHPESVVQDVAVPIEHAAEFLGFLLRHINILPIWTCPTRAMSMKARYPLFHAPSTSLMIDFGFWGGVSLRTAHPPGYHNRLIEKEVDRLHGIKSLYSEAFYPEDEFWHIYNRAAYDELKQRYDPDMKLKNLYQKCVLRA